MPYIDRKKRNEALVVQHDAGELNFAVTSLVRDYLYQWPESYAKYNEVIGVLEAAKLEVYRRQVATYEDQKIAANGDVW